MKRAFFIGLGAFWIVGVTFLYFWQYKPFFSPAFSLVKKIFGD